MAQPILDRMSLSTKELTQHDRMFAISVIGRLRQNQLYDFLKSRYKKEDGYEVKSYDRYSVFPDVVVFHNGVPVMAIEIKNYGVDKYMSKRVFDRILFKFSCVPKDCYKLLVVSSENNLIIKQPKYSHNKQYTSYTILYNNYVYTEEFLKKLGIHVMIMGRQDRPFMFEASKYECINWDNVKWDDINE